METFREEESAGRIPILLGGKVLVLDIDLSVDQTDTEVSIVKASGVKTSYASVDGATPTASSSASLAGLIQDSLNALFDAAQTEEDVRDVLHVAELAKRIRGHFTYLMQLDQLALAEGSSGLRWFTALDELSSHLEKSASARAQQTARRVPLHSQYLRHVLTHTQ
jgi:hypothetical protein